MPYSPLGKYPASRVRTSASRSMIGLAERPRMAVLPMGWRGIVTRAENDVTAAQRTVYSHPAFAAIPSPPYNAAI